MNELAVPEIVDNEAYDIGQLYLKGCACQIESVKYLREAGAKLLDKKASMPHGEWLPWLQQNWDVLGFTTERTAQRLIKLANTTPASDLENLTEQEALEIGRTVWGHAQKEPGQFSLETPQLPSGQYHVIYADPPWSYGDKLIEGYGAAEHHYPAMTTDTLAAMPVQSLVSDTGVLFLWATSPMLPDALRICEAWGFEYKATFVWDKVKHNFGHYNSVRHELLLIATRGSFLPRTNTLIDSVQTIERTDKHSEKPEEFRAIIDTLYPGTKRIELFRRGAAPDGWEVWGNEAH